VHRLELLAGDSLDAGDAEYLVELVEECYQALPDLGEFLCALRRTRRIT
jgi:hypothetical protein